MILKVQVDKVSGFMFHLPPPHMTGNERTGKLLEPKYNNNQEVNKLAQWLNE